MLGGMMDIGEVAKRSGIAPSALRYYEEAGLINPTGRNGLRRQYSPDILEKLALISLAKQAGFQLAELTRLFKTGGRQIFIDRVELKKKSLEIERHIKKLEAAREGLIHASQCRAPSHLECPKFQRLLSIATKQQIKKRKDR